MSLSLVTVAYPQPFTIHDLFTFSRTGTSCPDGAPPDTIIQASDGNFYGLTAGLHGEEYDLRRPARQRARTPASSLPPHPSPACYYSV
jgi:hypothetical protein